MQMRLVIAPTLGKQPSSTKQTREAEFARSPALVMVELGLRYFSHAQVTSLL